MLSTRGSILSHGWGLRVVLIAKWEGYRGNGEVGNGEGVSCSVLGRWFGSETVGKGSGPRYEVHNSEGSVQGSEQTGQYEVIISRLLERRREERSLNNNSFLGEYKCSSLVLDREERREEDIRSLETRSNNISLMEMKLDIENMTLNEHLEYEAEKERRLWDNVRSRRSPNNYDEADIDFFHRNKRAKNMKRIGQDIVQDNDLEEDQRMMDMIGILLICGDDRNIPLLGEEVWMSGGII
ncbi:hypothetical protein Tco_0256894 [Tanacetum coccineum]